MLVIISDLHPSDVGTTHAFDAAALEVISDRVDAAALSRGAREIRLVLLGDTDATYVPGHHDRVLHNFPALRDRLTLPDSPAHIHAAACRAIVRSPR